MTIVSIAALGESSNGPFAACKYCSILLNGRSQFIGHMIHAHEIADRHALEIWKSSTSTKQAGQPSSLSSTHNGVTGSLSKILGEVNKVK